MVRKADKPKPVRIAFCVICHKYTPVLKALTEWLGEGNDFYIHVDAKADIAPFEPLRKLDNVFLVEERTAVFWGGYSQIESYLKTIGATRHRRYDHIALLSGDSLPLRSNADIKRFLAESGPDTEYVIEESSDKRLARRIGYRYPEIGYRHKTGLIARARVKFRLFPKRSTRFSGFSKGPVWIIVTPAFRDYIFEYLEHNPWYTEEFAESWCGDEMFFHMLLKESPFASRASDLLTMYTDWHTGPDAPRTLDESDFERLRRAKNRNDGRHHFLFARKINDDMDLARYRAEILEGKS
jgi:hypothetical protein